MKWNGLRENGLRLDCVVLSQDKSHKHTAAVVPSTSSRMDSGTVLSSVSHGPFYSLATAVFPDSYEMTKSPPRLEGTPS